jgi:hypothetical protein
MSQYLRAGIITFALSKLLGASLPASVAMGLFRFATAKYDRGMK